MKTYTINFKYSSNGTSWTGITKNIKAESDVSAIMQIQSSFAFVKDIRIISVK